MTRGSVEFVLKLAVGSIALVLLLMAEALLLVLPFRRLRVAYP